jgi:hypothetical protein
MPRPDPSPPAPTPSPPGSQPPAPGTPPTSGSNAAITVIAKGLNIYTLQGVAIAGDEFIVPNLDGQLLRIQPSGATSILVDLYKAELGIPFGIVENQGSFVVTASDYLPRHYLVRVKLDGTYQEIADLAQKSGFYGAPFGVAVEGKDYIVTVSTDVVSSSSQLIRVTEAGKISKIAELSTFGIPFGVVVSDRGYVVTQEKGQVLRITPEGTITPIVDLAKAGFGTPLGIANGQTHFIVTTNTGQVVQITPEGAVSPLVDLRQAKFGVPSGVVIYQDYLIVTTNSGYLLKIRKAG